MGNCYHRHYIPKLLELVTSHALEPTLLLSQRAPLSSAIEAYKAFDRREEGWLKVELVPEQARMAA